MCGSEEAKTMSIFKSDIANECFEYLKKTALDLNVSLGDFRERSNKLSEIAAYEISFHSMMARAWEVAANIEISILQAACAPKMTAREAKNRIEFNHQMACSRNKVKSQFDKSYSVADIRDSIVLVEAYIDYFRCFSPIPVIAIKALDAKQSLLALQEALDEFNKEKADFTRRT
jgi:hypothetical protein